MWKVQNKHKVYWWFPGPGIKEEQGVTANSCGVYLGDNEGILELVFAYL